MNIHTAHGDRLLLGFPAKCDKMQTFRRNKWFFLQKMRNFAH